MSMMQEFKEFAMKGSVIDMTVGVIVAGAFGKVISSLLNDVLMPPIGLLMGGADFTDLKLVIKHAAGDQKEVAISYGAFITHLIDFAIVAFVIFSCIKMVNRLREQTPAKPA